MVTNAHHDVTETRMTLRSLFLVACAVLSACGSTEPPGPVATVTITQVAGSDAPVSLSLTSASRGQAFTLYATVRDATGRPIDACAVAWTSSNPNAATVSTSGIVTISYGPQSTTIRAECDGKVGIVTIAVPFTPGSVKSVAVSPANATVSPGSAIGLAASVLTQPGIAATVAWTTSDLAVATVDAAGTVRAVSKGKVTITARSTVDPTILATADVIVP